MNHTDLKQLGYTAAQIVRAENIAKSAAKELPPTYMKEHGIEHFQPHSWVILAVLKGIDGALPCWMKL